MYIIEYRFSLSLSLCNGIAINEAKLMFESLLFLSLLSDNAKHRQICLIVYLDLEEISNERVLN